MSTSTTFDTLTIGDYFSIPGNPGVLCRRVKYTRWGEGAVRGGFNSVVLKHPKAQNVNCGDYIMPDTKVVREPRERHIKPFSVIGVGKRAAFRDEPSTVIKKIRPKRLRSGGKLVNAAVVSFGIVRARLAEHSRRGVGGYLFISPNEHLLIA